MKEYFLALVLGHGKVNREKKKPFNCFIVNFNNWYLTYKTFSTTNDWKSLKCVGEKIGNLFWNSQRHNESFFTVFMCDKMENI